MRELSTDAETRRDLAGRERVTRGHGAVNADDVATFGRCISVGGVALFPADTVYGLATEPHSREGVDRLYAAEGAPAGAPAAVMFFRLDLALAALPELGERTRTALGAAAARARSPLVLPNRARRFPLACGPEPERLGLRVPALEGELAPLARGQLAGAPVEREPERRPGRRAAWPTWTRRIRDGVDMVLDARRAARHGVHRGLAGGATRTTASFEVLREGALAAARSPPRCEPVAPGARCYGDSR